MRFFLGAFFFEVGSELVFEVDFGGALFFEFDELILRFFFGCGARNLIEFDVFFRPFDSFFGRRGGFFFPFGGGALVASAALATFEAIEEEKLLLNARNMGDYLRKKLEALKEEFPFIKNVKGQALMCGVELSIDGRKIFEECVKRGLIINCTQGNILRIMPPLIVKKRDIDKAINIIRDSIKASV